jgi:UDP-N-acetylmuramate dehydrogenase
MGRPDMESGGYGCRKEGVVLAERTTFEIGGEALEYYAPADVTELSEVCRFLASEGKRPQILGGGSNTLFPDGPFGRPVISTENLRSLRVEGNRISAGAGVRLEALIRCALDAGLSGLELLVGIPGSVGGAIAMNAGGGSHSFGDRAESIEAVEIATGKVLSIPGRSVRWDYRSAHLDGLVVASAVFLLEPGDTASLRLRARDWLKKKASLQPISAASAGCVFKNTSLGSAGMLIEKAGMKGAREGGAVVSHRHANFILNEDGRASASDVLALLEKVRDRVREVFGVELETEIVIACDERTEIHQGGEIRPQASDHRLQDERLVVLKPEA